MLALVLFGAKRLPEIGRSLGSGMREFKDSLSGVKDSLSLDEPPAEPSVGGNGRSDDKPSGTSAS